MRYVELDKSELFDRTATHPLGEIHLDRLDTDVLGSSSSGSHDENALYVSFVVLVYVRGVMSLIKDETVVVSLLVVVWLSSEGILYGSRGDEADARESVRVCESNQRERE